MTRNPATGEAALELSVEECMALLATQEVGRLCILDHGYPAAYPVNYRLAPRTNASTALIIRTRPTGVLDQHKTAAGFEIDDINPITATGWCVVVKGTLLHADIAGTPLWARDWDPRPWLTQRDLWMVLLPETVSGRRLIAGAVEWAFSIHAYA